MTKTEIDQRLALAIGYSADRVRIAGGLGTLYKEFVQVWNDEDREDGPLSFGGWQRFDHTDPAVICPIAERFDAFPIANCIGGWLAHGVIHEVAATASALAVIQYVESKA